MSSPAIGDLGEVDALLATAIMRTEAERALSPTEIVAVSAIVGLSLAGAALMTDASFASLRDVTRLSTRARAQMDDARQLIADLSTIRSGGLL